MMQLEHNERECQGGKVLRLDYYEAYDFNSDYGHVHYTICDYEVQLGFDEVTGDPIPDGNGGQAFTIFKWPRESGSLELDAATCNSWGADDQPIFNYVAQQLSITLV